MAKNNMIEEVNLGRELKGTRLGHILTYLILTLVWHVYVKYSIQKTFVKISDNYSIVLTQFLK